jgi:hypothetical protein
LGGSIALYSAGSAPAGFSGEARAAAGNLGIVRGALGAAYGWDKGWIRVAGSAQKQDQVLDPSNQYRSTGAFVGLGRQLGENTLVTFNYFNSYSAVPIPIISTPYSSTSYYPSYDPNRQDFNRGQILSGTVRTQFSDVLSGELTIGQVLQVRLEPDLGSNVAPIPYSSSRNQVVGHVTWQPSSTGSLQVGIDGSEETAKSPDPSDFTESTMLHASARHLAILVDGQKELFTGFRAVASLRTERDRQTVPTATAAQADNSITQTTGKLGVNWILPKGFRVYANAGNGFSNPLLYNTIWNAQYQGDTLNNEKSRTAQAGASFASGPWKAGLEFSRTLFSSLVTYNEISTPSMPYGIYQNGSGIRIQSAELKGGYETAVWGLDGFYRNQEARDLQAPAGQEFTNTSVLRRPFQTLGANAYRILGDFRLEGRWSWIGPRYDYLGSSGMAFDQHYNDLSLSVAWSVQKDLTLTLRGENLMQPTTTLAQWMAGTRNGQNDASQIYGYPAQPPTVTLEVRYRF